jgi:hypothetical protein
MGDLEMRELERAAALGDTHAALRLARVCVRAPLPAVELERRRLADELGPGGAAVDGAMADLLRFANEDRQTGTLLRRDLAKAVLAAINEAFVKSLQYPPKLPGFCQVSWPAFDHWARIEGRSPSWHALPVGMRSISARASEGRVALAVVVSSEGEVAFAAWDDEVTNASNALEQAQNRALERAKQLRAGRPRDWLDLGNMRAFPRDLMSRWARHELAY